MATEADFDRIYSALETRWYSPGIVAPPSSRSANGALAEWLTPLFEQSGSCLAFHVTYRDSYRSMCYADNVLKDCGRFLAEMESSFGRPAGARLVGVEKHPSGRDILHAHMLLGGEWAEGEKLVLQAHWTASRGWCVAKRLLQVSGAVLYCSKHHLKQGGECAMQVPQPHPRTRHERRLSALASIASFPADALPQRDGAPVRDPAKAGRSGTVAPCEEGSASVFDVESPALPRS